jgi:predicted acylesterase/phospholipase RssA
MSNGKLPFQNEDQGYFHFIAGPGGCRAMLASLGALMALAYVGIRQFRSLGGISGGSIPTAFLAAGYSLEQIAEIAIALDFQSLLDEEAPMSKVMARHYRTGRHKSELPENGRYKMSRLARWLNSALSCKWPAATPYWTMATDQAGAQILMSQNGVFRRIRGGSFQTLTEVPQSAGLAICASCAVPGLFSPIKVEELIKPPLTLYDGALSWEGARPVSIVQGHFGAPEETIIICDVGVDLNASDKLYSILWKVVCGGRCVAKWTSGPNRIGALLITPSVNGVRSFEFSASADKKWQAIIEGFLAAVAAMKIGGRLTAEQDNSLTDLCIKLSTLLASTNSLPAGKYASLTRALLVEAGVLSQ